MDNKPHAGWTAKEWTPYNHAGLEGSNLVVVSAGSLSIAFCIVCREILIRHNNETEAETFNLNLRTYIGFLVLLMPQVLAYRMTVLLAAAWCAGGGRASKKDRPVESTRLLAATYHGLTKAIDRFEYRCRRHLQPKVGEVG